MLGRPSAGALAFRQIAGRWPMHWTGGAFESPQTESLNS